MHLLLVNIEKVIKSSSKKQIVELDQIPIEKAKGFVRWRNKIYLVSRTSGRFYDQSDNHINIPKGSLVTPIKVR